MNKLAQVTLSFWIMRICATTLGETAGDLLTKLVAKGGLDFGTMGSSLVLASILLIAITCAAMRDARMARQRS